MTQGLLRLENVMKRMTTAQDTDLVQPGPEMVAKLREQKAHLRNEVVLSIAREAGVKPFVVRNAVSGRRMQRVHWECLASYLRLPGLTADVKARWTKHRRALTQKRARIREALAARAGDIPRQLRIARLDSTRGDRVKKSE